jgi:hypothetical protein
MCDGAQLQSWPHSFSQALPRLHLALQFARVRMHSCSLWPVAAVGERHVEAAVWPGQPSASDQMELHVELALLLSVRFGVWGGQPRVWVVPIMTGLLMDRMVLSGGALWEWGGAGVGAGHVQVGASCLVVICVGGIEQGL